MESIGQQVCRANHCVAPSFLDNPGKMQVILNSPLPPPSGLGLDLTGDLTLGELSLKFSHYVQKTCMKSVPKAAAHGAALFFRYL